MTISETGRNRWRVKSESGHTYEVKLLTKLDQMGSMYFVWTCTCPSRKYPCKHALAVATEYPAMDEQAAERVL